VKVFSVGCILLEDKAFTKAKLKEQNSVWEWKIPAGLRGGNGPLFDLPTVAFSAKMISFRVWLAWKYIT
jgi:hypothetical protein